MEIALISDIHGNLPALEAVKDDIETKSPDKVICLGDVIGYNPWPSECVSIVRDYCDVILQGNHDRDVRNPDKYRVNKMAYEGLVLAKKELSDEQYEWLQQLSDKKQIKVGSKLYTAVHSHPRDTDKYVKPKDFKKVRSLISDDKNGCWMGHTHMQHTETIDDCLMLNPGSVGQPRDGDKRAAYAIVDTEHNEAELHRVNYDVHKVIQQIKTVGLPPRTGKRLL